MTMTLNIRKKEGREKGYFCRMQNPLFSRVFVKERGGKFLYRWRDDKDKLFIICFKADSFQGCQNTVFFSILRVEVKKQLILFNLLFIESDTNIIAFYEGVGEAHHIAIQKI